MQHVHDSNGLPNIEVHLGPRQMKIMTVRTPTRPSLSTQNSRQLMKFFSRSQDRNSLPSPTGRGFACKGALSRTTSAAGTSIPVAEMWTAPLAFFSAFCASGVAAIQVGLPSPRKTGVARKPAGVGMRASLVSYFQWISVPRYPGG
jgi:hypothetical protein